MRVSEMMSEILHVERLGELSKEILKYENAQQYVSLVFKALSSQLDQQHHEKLSHMKHNACLRLN